MTDLTVRSSTELSPAEAMIAQMAAKLKANVRVSSPVITCGRNGKLKMPNDEQVESVDVVLLDFIYRNQYYPKPYTEGVTNECTCWAVGGGSNDLLVPSLASSDKQAESCAVCPKNQFGSHPSGSKGKACNNQLLLAVTPTDFDPDADPEVWTIKAQPTALRQISPYLLKMTDMHGHPIKVITTLSLDPAANYPSLRTNFAALNPLWEQHITLMDLAQRALNSGSGVPTGAEQVDSSTKLPERLG